MCTFSHHLQLAPEIWHRNNLELCFKVSVLSIGKAISVLTISSHFCTKFSHIATIHSRPIAQLMALGIGIFVKRNLILRHGLAIHRWV